MAAASVLASLARLAGDSKTGDLTLVCGGERRQVHSPILTERSPFFQSLVERWTGEEVKEVTLGDCAMDTRGNHGGVKMMNHKRHLLNRLS